MKRLAVVAAALAGAGLLGGTLLDEAPERAPVFRGGFRVLEADFHAHTRFSDGLLSPFDLVVQARRRGLDALAVTEHNLTFPGKMARWYAEHTGGPAILVGEEVTTGRYHVHGIGLTARIDADAPLESVIDEVHRQGGVVIAAHPVRRFWPALVPARDRIDGAEVMHPIAYGSRGGGGSGWRWDEMRAYYADALAAGRRLTAIGASDYHFFSPLGVCRTLVFVPRDAVPDAAAVLDALRAGRTVVRDLEGQAWGDPDLVELLRAEPYEMRPQDYGYAGSGWADRVARVLAWLGLAGLVALRKRG